MTCSFAWDAAELPAWGTAPRADFWVALEQTGPWGAKAFTHSRLDPAVGAAIEQAAADAGGRALLIRRPGRHADHADHPVRQVYVAGGLAARPWLLAGRVMEPEQILELPFANLASADPGALVAAHDWLRPVEGGVLLVCANAKRDLCCALRGRPIALELDSRRPGRVWECTHTGGHRFAPTGVLLPSGQCLARLTPQVAVAALTALDAGRLAAESLGPWHDRGRSHLEPRAAVAEAHVRALIGETDPGALSVDRAGRDSDAEGLIQVTHRDGRNWTVRLTLAIHPDDLPESCAKAAVTAHWWSAEVVGRRTA